MDIKKILLSKNIILGKDKTLRLLKKGKISEILLANNVPELVKKDITSLANLAGAKVSVLTYTNDELGALCKKPFTVSIIGLTKKIE